MTDKFWTIKCGFCGFQCVEQDEMTKHQEERHPAEMAEHREEYPTPLEAIVAGGSSNFHGVCQCGAVFSGAGDTYAEGMRAQQAHRCPWTDSEALDR